MKKSILEPVIKKYHLHDINEISIWKVDDAAKTLRIGATTPNRVMTLVVQVNNFTELKTLKFGVNDTTKLLKMLNVLDEDITIAPNVDAAGKITSILFTSGEIEMQYVTADLEFLEANKVVKVYDKAYPPFEAEIVLDKDFRETYTAAKSALSDSEYVVFQMNSKNKLEMVFGNITNGNKALNTSKIKYAVKTLPGKDTLPHSIGYNAEYLNKILLSNKDADDSVLKLSSNTLAYAQFTCGDIVSTYHVLGVAGK